MQFSFIQSYPNFEQVALPFELRLNVATQHVSNEDSYAIQNSDPDRLGSIVDIAVQIGEQNRRDKIQRNSQ